MTTTLPAHPVVSQEQWIAQRKALMEREKQLTRLHDELAAERRKLPWVRIDKDYVFETPGGSATLADLFRGRSQLVIYHFMFGPDWKEGCPSCSFLADHFDGMLPHLAARDVSMAVVSRAPLEKLAAFRQRMGWRFNWVSSHGSSFNYDFNVSFTPEQVASGAVYYNYAMQEFPSAEAPGISIFHRNEAGEIFHTYSAFGRGVEQLVGTYMVLDMSPRGRDEDGLNFPMAWVRYHDRYETNVFADADKPYWPQAEATTAASAGSCGCGSARE